MAVFGCGRSQLDLPYGDDTGGTTGSAGVGGTNGAAGMNAGAAGRAATFRATLAAGTTFSCANVRSGLYCWGATPQGTFNGTNVVPTQDAWKAGLISTLPIDQIAAAQTNACSIEAGQVTCGGDNTLGQDAVPPTATDCTPSGCNQLASIPGLSGAVQIAVSGAHGCAVMGDSTVRCWGGNDWGQLGHAPGTSGDTSCVSPTTPVDNCSQQPEPIDGLSGVVEVAVGADATGEHGVSCARLKDGSVQCWGDNTTGAVLGWVDNSSKTDSVPHPTPMPVSLPGPALRIVAGGLSVCAIVAGEVICWGDDSAGQSGPPSGVQITGPKGTAAALDQVTDLAKGLLHTCAVSNGQVFCWGNNTSKQLGRDENISYDAPCTVAGQPTYCSVTASPVVSLSHVVTLAAGSSHTCALLDDNSVRCWGSNINQQLGYQLQKFGDLDPRATPVKVQGLP
ncbi:MAG TPA: hypothetical protein VH560_09450 [Polyangia bacterium]|nr:hypothetical protein [Polyangia bacterium]